MTQRVGDAPTGKVELLGGPLHHETIDVPVDEIGKMIERDVTLEDRVTTVVYLPHSLQRGIWSYVFTGEKDQGIEWEIAEI